MPTKNILFNLHEKYIKNTPHKAAIADKTALLCHLTYKVQKELSLSAKVYTNTRIIKHLYDKKPAQQYDFVICNLHTIVRYPNKIYQNKNPNKRGDYCFTKIVKGKNYFASLENKEDKMFVVTCFQVKENYLKDYKLLWSWKGGEPSS